MVKGYWHDQGSAAQLEAALHSEGEYYTLTINSGENFSGLLADLLVSDRLGKVERKIVLENGSVFVTNDNDAVDALFKGQNKMVAVLHALESNMGWVLVALALTVVCSVSFFKWGVPWVSTKIAHALPHKANEMISAHTLGFLDDYFFEPSKLDAEQRKQIEAHFTSQLLPVTAVDSGVRYALHFRQWGEGANAIPNALALPSGDIILTDRFVELSKSQNEIDAVLLHEIGHVVYRHTLETVVESTLLTTVVMMVTGDSNGLADLGIGLGSLLVSSNYSRGHESEADLYAFNKMLTVGIDPNAFSQIMQRITADVEKTGIEEKDVEEAKMPKQSKAKSDSILDYISSHPSTAERIEQAERFSRCYKQGLRVCKVAGNDPSQ